MKYKRLAMDFEGGETLSIQASLFTTRRRFLAYMRSKKIGDLKLSGKDSAAHMWTFPDYAIEQGDPFAEMCFYGEMFSVETITHEVTHSVIQFFRRCGWDISAGEEMFCKIVGEFTRDFVDWRGEVMPQ